MQNSEKITKLEELFEVGEGEIKEATLLEKIESWDSLTKLSLLVMLDEEYGKTITGTQINRLVTIKDILNYME
ncbi:MAG TPA: acyl carrier protein [Anaerovoracaceae bacterium]|nr:acyl carrier protein [Anaerovoracaceae bacterium]